MYQKKNQKRWRGAVGSALPPTTQYDLDFQFSDSDEIEDSDNINLEDETLQQSADHLFLVLSEMFPTTNIELLTAVWEKHRPNLETAVYHIINNQSSSQSRSFDGEALGVQDWPGLTSTEAEFFDEWSVATTSDSPTNDMDVGEDVSGTSCNTISSSFSFVQEQV
eukprot:c52245_g1_i1.p1 GENE.c52245_g1_i1~~c52245_g1_i1.p1  ORF type:complete len:165 (-),score=33.43 c52245_g1_i1:70-564(-)